MDWTKQRFALEGPKDMKWFKMNTWGSTVIMGRRTFESCKLLPGRRNIVISRRPKPDVNVEWYNHLDVAMQHVDDAFSYRWSRVVHYFSQVCGCYDSDCVEKIRGDVFFEVPPGKLCGLVRSGGIVLKYTKRINGCTGKVNVTLILF